MQPCSYVTFVIDNGRSLHALTAAIADESCIVSDPATTLWGLREMARPEESKIEARRVGSLERGYSPSPPARESGERCSKLPTAATWRFGTFG